jgi:hypothetical protein
MRDVKHFRERGPMRRLQYAASNAPSMIDSCVLPWPSHRRLACAVYSCRMPAGLAYRDFDARLHPASIFADPAVALKATAWQMIGL